MSEKNIVYVALISREKIFSWRLMLEKKSYTVVSQGTIGLGIFLFTPTKSHIPGLKGQMVGLLEPKGLY